MKLFHISVFVGPLFKLLSRLSLCSLPKKAPATAPATFLIPPMTWHQQRVLQCLRRVERIAVGMARMPWDTWLLCWLRVISRWVIVPYIFFTYFTFVTFISKWIRLLKAKFLLACISVHTPESSKRSRVPFRVLPTIYLYQLKTPYRAILFLGC